MYEGCLQVLHVATYVIIVPKYHMYMYLLCFVKSCLVWLFKYHILSDGHQTLKYETISISLNLLPKFHALKQD